MKYLFFADAVVLVLSSVMTITLAVVCLLFVLYAGSAPEIARGVAGLFRVTTGFLLLGVASAAATWAVFRRARAWPGLQALLVVVIPVAVILVRTGLGAR